MEHRAAQSVKTLPGPSGGAGPLALTLLAVVLLLGGCASRTATEPAHPTDPDSREASTTGTVPPGTPTASSPCPTTGTPGLSDGTWAGPLSVRVRATAPHTGARGTGSGELQVSVEGGKVTGGTWALAWDSTGPSSAHESQATVRLHGVITGTLTGAATGPQLEGRWRITGSATVTSPVTATASVEESGQGRTVLALRTTACDAVTAGFALSFRSADAFAASAATGRWTGRRTG